MGTKLILPFVVSITPLIILAVYFFVPGHNAVRYFIPRFLPDKEYPKVSVRQAGSGCLVLSIWLVAIIAAVSSTIDFKILEKMMWLLALLCFVFPIISAVFFCAGIYYLIIGTFGKSDNIRPQFQSVFCADKANVKLYVRKLKFYTALNLSFILAGILSITACVVLEKHVGEKLIPLNMICLIGFIITLWRVRTYITKTALVMNLPGKAYFLSTLFSPIGILFVWIHAFTLIRKYALSSAKNLKPNTQN